MKVIFVRSPYKIVVDEPTQVYTKVELFIWANNVAEPTVPTRVLERQIVDVTNIDCWYNISPYIKDYIESITIGSISFSDEEFAMWQRVKAVKYYKVNIGDAWTLIDDEEFVAVNGYTNYIGGLNQSDASDVVLLANHIPQLKRGDNDQYFNILVDFDPANNYNLVARYRNLANAIIEDYVVFDYTSSPAGIFMLKIPFRTATAGLENGNSVQMRLDTSGATPAVERMYFINGDTCLYTPIICTFINSKGGWQFLTFFKARSDSYDTKSKDYNLLPDAQNYNPSRGQKKSFNFEQNQKSRLNTGWVDENYIELLTDLLNSETILLDNIPVVMASKSIQKKTQVRGKMINYEMDFEYAFNLINDAD